MATPYQYQQNMNGIQTRSCQADPASATDSGTAISGAIAAAIQWRGAKLQALT
jgi:hypothetical protein